MTAVNLVPLAAQTANNPIINQLTNTMTASSSKDSSSKSLSPLLRPQALLFNPDVLVRATLAERLSSQAAGLTSMNMTAAFRSNPSLTSTPAILANPLRQLQQQQQQQYHQRLHRQLLQLQQIQKTPTAKDIIGMGIQIPNPKTTKTATAPAAAPTRRPTLGLPKQQTLKALQQKSRMMKYGKPLMAPPRLATKICKRSKRTAEAISSSSLPPACVTIKPMTLPSVNTNASSTANQRPAQRRKLNHSTPSVLLAPPVAMKTLSSDELDFVEAAQRLHHSPRGSPKTALLAVPLTQKALKPPPALSF